MIAKRIKAAIRDVPDFPEQGIVFKDITPILKDFTLCQNIVEDFALQLKDMQIDAIAGIESRGFLFGLALATSLHVPFLPVRKAGKLPFTVKQKAYKLEYGTAAIEMHTDAFEPGQHILIHDDVLATGGTALAASELIKEMGGNVSGFSFIVELSFLEGRKKLQKVSDNIVALAHY